MAKWLCRTSDRHLAPRVPGPNDHLQRGSPAANSFRLCVILQSSAHALGIRERCALASNSPTIWRHRRHSDLGWAASSIRPDMIFGKDRKTFLHNHADGIAAMDLFVVPKILFRLLYGLLIVGHGRRQIIWFGVTAHPTAEWIANQITEACGWEQAPCYLIRDRDGAYGEIFIRKLRSMGIRDRPSSPRSPWQNGYAERPIGSIRRECVDHIIVLGERHLRHVLLSYMKYYNEVRTCP